MKLLFTTDLHGSIPKYEKILKVAEFLKVDAVINGGDMLPKHGDLFRQGTFISEYLDSYFRKFNTLKIRYLCYLGNDDLRIFDELFENTCRRYSFVVNLAQRKIKIGRYEFIGMNWVADYPFRLKDRCRMDTRDYVFEEQIGSGLLSLPGGWHKIDDWPSYAKGLPTIDEELRELPTPDNMENCIYIMHMPPAKLGLDVCSGGKRVGSQAIYDFIKKQQPKLTLHGHIHESPEVSGVWRAKLGRTICIQPGQRDTVEVVYIYADLSRMEFQRMIEPAS